MGCGIFMESSEILVMKLQERQEDWRQISFSRQGMIFFPVLQAAWEANVHNIVAVQAASVLQNIDCRVVYRCFFL